MAVFGTRPEAVKMAPVVARLRESAEFRPIVVVTAQHREMLDQVLRLFDIAPDRDLDIMRPEQSLFDIAIRALAGLDPVLRELRPAMVLVQGDAASTMLGALAAFYHRIPVGHVEAGLRTHDKYQPYPEEMNRRLTSVLADLHFAPTPWARDNLLREGTPRERVVVTGNTVIDALREEGRPEDAEWLRKEWEKKVKYFVYDDPYPFDSEYPFDTTAFESSHAIAKYGLERLMEPDENLWYHKTKGVWYSHPEVKREHFQEFMEKQIQANIALRGWLEPAFYLLGSDYRGGNSSRYQLSYMSQLGGWAIVDYALYHAQDPTPYLQLGYASYLSSWALMNTGRPETNYGYWYPGKENDGASGWAFLPEKYGPMWIRKEQGRGAWFYDGEIDLGYGGALRTAATIVTDDPLFGLFAYGGLVSETHEGISVVPRDGLRKRFHLVRGERRLRLLLDQDGFAAEKPVVVDNSLARLRFILENRTHDAHATTLRIAGLAPGRYDLWLDGWRAATITATQEEWAIVTLQLTAAETFDVDIRSAGNPR
ncbi:MAG: UDP-N-acetylglucosamine 2-epimerase (non-hydrolyzing) [Candidatus Rokubacteria bacterium]|nr:UDP-N-acetylglucosamine 2-epimerase (non-hydrolyzing) [Candidatus Rokubacteria bacterium]